MSDIKRKLSFKKKKREENASKRLSNISISNPVAGIDEKSPVSSINIYNQ